MKDLAVSKIEGKTNFSRSLKQFNQSISLIATLRPESRIANVMQLK